jgi:hypothetical protein
MRVTHAGKKKRASSLDEPDNEAQAVDGNQMRGRAVKLQIKVQMIPSLLTGEESVSPINDYSHRGFLTDASAVHSSGRKLRHDDVINYKNQGDESMYEPGAVAKRKSLREDSQIIWAVERFWAMFRNLVAPNSPSRPISAFPRRKDITSSRSPTRSLGPTPMRSPSRDPSPGSFSPIDVSPSLLGHPPNASRASNASLSLPPRSPRPGAMQVCVCVCVCGLCM